MEHTFVRDHHSKALINTDTEAIHLRRQQKKQVQTVHELQQEITEVKNDLLEIKNLLRTIISQRG